MDLTGSKVWRRIDTKERMKVVDRGKEARMLECTPKLLPFIQQSQTGTLNLNTRGVMVPTWSTGSAA